MATTIGEVRERLRKRELADWNSPTFDYTGEMILANTDIDWLIKALTDRNASQAWTSTDDLQVVAERSMRAVQAMMFSGGALAEHLKYVLVYMDALEAKVRELAGKSDELEKKP